MRGADAVVFAAGAGPGSGEARKTTMDLGGAVKLIEAAKAEGVSRYLIVSSMGAADAPAEGADPAAGATSSAPTCRPSSKPTRRSAPPASTTRSSAPAASPTTPAPAWSRIAERPDRGQIPRADVAAVFLACLDTPGTIGKSFDLIAGNTPIAAALAALPG